MTKPYLPIYARPLSRPALTLSPRFVLKAACIAVAVAGLAFLHLAQTARFYDGLNKGVAFDWGGYELVGEPGLFLCGFATEGNGLGGLQNFVIELAPGLLVDC